MAKGVCFHIFLVLNLIFVIFILQLVRLFPLIDKGQGDLLDQRSSHSTTLCFGNHSGRCHFRRHYHRFPNPYLHMVVCYSH